MADERQELPNLEERETEFRRRWHQAHVDGFDNSVAAAATPWRIERLDPHAAEAGAHLDALRRSGDLMTFQQNTDKWVRSFASGYAGTGGQMVINQIRKRTVNEDASVEVLLDALSAPRDLDDAVRKVRLLADHLNEIRVGAHPSPKRAPFVATYYWGLAEPDAWPVAWFKSVAYLAFCTGEPEPEDQGDRYRELYEFVMTVDGDPRRFERVAAWWADSNPVLVDEVLCDRSAVRERDERDYVSGADFLANANALVAVSGHIGSTLAAPVSEAAGRLLKPRKPSAWWTKDRPRADMWVDWSIPDTYGLGIRVWLNENGLAIGIRPYRDSGTEATERALAIIDTAPIQGFEVIKGGRAVSGRDVGFRGGGSGEVMYGRWFDRSMFANLDLPAEVTMAAKASASLIALLAGEQEAVHDDQLSSLVEEFKEATDYPNAGHEQDIADRRLFRRILDPDELDVVAKTDLRRIWNSTRYGGTGPMPTLNITLRDADEEEYQRIIDTIRFLCWGPGDTESRIDAALTNENYRIKGLGESVVMKLLAITDPKRFITVYPYQGPSGKLKMLKLLDLPEPEGSSRGELQTRANDVIRERLEHFFPDDSLGVGAFLYWLLERPDPVDEQELPVDTLGDLADTLLVDRTFVEEIVELLEDKRQVVFYGPPGTGKTFFARKLAEVLAPEPERRPIVQFHPSTSYEDFFEGYRPVTDADGVMTYRLQRGPLAELAALAATSPGSKHVMVIDEINRANLPKVLGEMLFLFENRNTPVRTLYRPDDPFELPKDIWFIGTMNTADRSIALVDAALRRRFHFVPFFPNHGPMSGLLDRWLAREGEPAWVGDLVQQVNSELERVLGGPHLQLGPSHFMKTGLTEERLKRIWMYNIEPFIEDQFFGDPHQIEYFRFVNVFARFRDLAGEVIDEAESLTDDET